MAIQHANTGQTVDTDTVPKIVRNVALAIAFGAGEGPWWHYLPVALEVIHLVGAAEPHDFKPRVHNYDN